MELDARGRPLSCEHLRGTGMMLLATDDLFVVMIDGQRASVISPTELASFFDQSWAALMKINHPVLKQPGPSAQWKAGLTD